MTHATDIAARLALIASELQQLAKSLGGQGDPAFPQSAKQKVKTGCCLGDCGRTSPPYKFRRGNCPTCSNKVNRAIAKMPGVEFTLIEEGRLAPVGYNPEPTPLDASIQKAAKAVEKASAAEVVSSTESAKSKIDRKDKK